MKLTRAQEKLLRELPDLPSDGLRCTGSRKRTADTLRGKGLVTVTGARNLVCWYARTAEGTKQVQEWDHRWVRVEQMMRVSVHRMVERSRVDEALLLWALNVDHKRYSELHERVRKEERDAYMKALRGEP